VKMSQFDKTNKGKRVRLIYTNDQHTSLESGDEGTYEMALVNPDMVQHLIKWDNGSNLMLIDGVDSFEFIED
jgi:hypothetical protein